MSHTAQAPETGLHTEDEQPAPTEVGAGGQRSNLARFLARNGVMLAVYGVLTFLVVLPLGMLLFATLLDAPLRPGTPVGNLTLDNYAQLFRPQVFEATFNTLLIGVGGTMLAMLFGCAMAWLSARSNVPWKAFIQVAGVMPLFISPLVGALAWALIASPRQGYLNILLRDLSIPVTINAYSLGGIIFVFGLYYAPYVFLLVNSALTLMNPELEEAAEVHGAGIRRVTASVTFKLVMPALLGAGMLTSVLIMENFPVPTVLGFPNGIASLPSQIYRHMAMAPTRPNEAAAAGILLLFITASLVYGQRRMLAGRDFTTVSGKGFRPRPTKLGNWRWPAFSFAFLYFLLAVALPFFALFQSTFRGSPFIPSFLSLFDPGSFSLNTMERVLDQADFQLSLRNTFITGVSAAFMGGALYILMSYLFYRTKLRGRAGLEYLAMWPLAVPALVIGMGFLWLWIRLPLPIYGTLWILVFAFIARFMPQGFRTISSTIGQVHRDLEESAYLAGAGRLRTARSILLPLMRTGVISTMVLVGILSMRELSTAIFLFTSRTQVLSVLIFNQWDHGQWPVVAAMSFLYSGVLLVITLLTRRWFGLYDTSN